jgi:hypothetical protein
MLRALVADQQVLVEIESGEYGLINQWPEYSCLGAVTILRLLRSPNFPCGNRLDPLPEFLGRGLF